jgi:polyisoprenoid-binding protein YceI
MRDDHLRTLGLEGDTYPEATFRLTQPITLPAAATSGVTLTVSATGELIIHGTTQTVTIPLTAKVFGSQIEVAGSISFPFEKFGVTPPSIGGFVSVQDTATMEFDVHFAHA